MPPRPTPPSRLVSRSTRGALSRSISARSVSASAHVSRSRPCAGRVLLGSGLDLGNLIVSLDEQRLDGGVVFFSLGLSNISADLVFGNSGKSIDVRAVFGDADRDYFQGQLDSVLGPAVCTVALAAETTYGDADITLHDAGVLEGGDIRLENIVGPPDSAVFYVTPRLTLWPDLSGNAANAVIHADYGATVANGAPIGTDGAETTVVFDYAEGDSSLDSQIVVVPSANHDEVTIYMLTEFVGAGPDFDNAELTPWTLDPASGQYYTQAYSTEGDRSGSYFYLGYEDQVTIDGVPLPGDVLLLVVGHDFNFNRDIQIVNSGEVAAPLPPVVLGSAADDFGGGILIGNYPGGGYGWPARVSVLRVYDRLHRGAELEHVSAELAALAAARGLSVTLAALDGVPPGAPQVQALAQDDRIAVLVRVLMPYSFDPVTSVHLRRTGGGDVDFGNFAVSAADRTRGYVEVLLDDDVEPGVAYVYYATATDANGTSLEGGGGANEFLAADAPGSVAFDQGALLLTWNEGVSLGSPAATAVEIHRSTDPAFTPDDSTLIATIATNVQEYVDTDPLGAPSVFYKVLLLNLVGRGAPSGAVGYLDVDSLDEILDLVGHYDSSNPASIDATGSTLNAWKDIGGHGGPDLVPGSGGGSLATGTHTLNGLNVIRRLGEKDLGAVLGAHVDPPYWALLLVEAVLIDGHEIGVLLLDDPGNGFTMNIIGEDVGSIYYDNNGQVYDYSHNPEGFVVAFGLQAKDVDCRSLMFGSFVWEIGGVAPGPNPYMGHIRLVGQSTEAWLCELLVGTGDINPLAELVASALLNKWGG